MTIAWKRIPKHVLRLRALLFCMAVFTTIAMKKQPFMNVFASYINCLRSVWAPVGCVSLATAHEKDNVPVFLYLRIAQVLIHNGSRRTRWLHFDGYSVKFAYRPIGQRGDPLKIIVYRVFIDIARENEPTFPCTCWVRAVAFLSAISAKLNIFQALCIATASGGLQSQHTEIQTCSSL